MIFFVCCRWAVKQEDLKNIGQWKNSTIQNPEWNKRALSWPVNEDGTWNMVRERITCHEDVSLLGKKRGAFLPISSSYIIVTANRWLSKFICLSDITSIYLQESQSSFN